MNIKEGQVETVLKKLGIDIDKEVGEELWAPCPYHQTRTGREDRHPSWSINRESGVFLCFSCHWKGNLYTLVRDLKGESVARALVVRGVVSVPISSERTLDRSFVRPTLLDMEPRTFEESKLAVYGTPPLWALTERKINAYWADNYGVKWDNIHEAWILPFRDPESARLIGYQTKFHKTRKFLNYPPGVSKATTLFGYHAALDMGVDRVAVVESPLDAVLVASVGCPAVAVCGSKISDDQLSLLRIFGQVGLALDDDDAGHKETDRILRMKTGISSFQVPHLGTGKDYGEMEVTEVVNSLVAGGLL